MLDEFYPGRRLSYDGDLCTVRYVGLVKGTKGEWLGVEWDDPTRGKHNGQHTGIEYFKCVSIEPHPASFVRPTRSHDASYNFVEALRNKYASDDFPNAAIDNQDTITISGKDVEEVGFEKIRQQLANLHGLLIVVLDQSCIGGRSGYVAQDVGETCPKVAELDMSRNLFEDFHSIVSIVKQLPRLSILNLDGNRLSNFDLSGEPSDLSQTVPFSRLQTLSLEDCLIGREHAIQVSSYFPSLKSLALGGNQLSGVCPSNLPSNLTHLSLERNLFKSLEELQPIARLEKLEQLNLKANQIRSIYTDSNDQPDSKRLVFSPSLQHVDLSSNQISSWAFVNAIPQVFPGIKSLRTSSNPLYTNTESEAKTKENASPSYILTVARIAQLETLNYSQITPKLRLDAEAFYLSQIGKELSAHSESNAIDILSHHPRYQELCKTYGEPVVNRTLTSTVESNTLAAHLLHLTFSLSRHVASETTKPTTWNIEIPASFSIYHVLGIVARHFGLSATNIRLIWETDEEDMAPDGVGQFGNDGYGQRQVQKFREERLEPKTRSIGTWLDGKAARIRVEWDEEQRKRQTDVGMRIAALLRT